MAPGSSADSRSHSVDRPEQHSSGEETPAEPPSTDRPREEDGTTGGKEHTGTLEERIVLLKGEKEKMRLERKRVLSELRNVQRRRSRLRKRCKLLGSEDLLEVLAMRQSAASGSATGPSATR